MRDDNGQQQQQQEAEQQMYSDRRLKTNIKLIGKHDNGMNIYAWDYIWGEHSRGVMADEVEEIMPEAVVMHPTGFKMVNYSMLGL